MSHVISPHIFNDNVQATRRPMVQASGHLDHTGGTGVGKLPHALQPPNAQSSGAGLRDQACGCLQRRTVISNNLLFSGPPPVHTSPRLPLVLRSIHTPARAPWPDMGGGPTAFLFFTHRVWAPWSGQEGCGPETVTPTVCESQMGWESPGACVSGGLGPAASNAAALALKSCMWPPVTRGGLPPRAALDA